MDAMQSSACALTTTDITIIDNEPRVTDVTLAAALGYAKVQDLRQLAERHRESLERFGRISTHRASKIGRGRPSEGMAFNKKQALYLGGKTDLPAGVELLIAMVEVFDAATKPAASSVPDQDSSPLALPMRGQTMTTADIFHPDVLVQIQRHARYLAESSIPRLQSELVHRLTHDLAGGRLWNPENEILRVSILSRYKPGSEDEERFLIDQWAWEMAPDIRNVAMRENLKAAITPILRGATKNADTDKGPAKAASARKAIASNHEGVGP